MMFTISSALLDACVLSTLERGESYGYALTQSLQERLECSESTLYPVLRRLESSGCLETENRLVSGRNRKTYRITEKGRAELSLMRREWASWKEKVNSLLEGEVE